MYFNELLFLEYLTRGIYYTEDLEGYYFQDPIVYKKDKSGKEYATFKYEINNANVLWFDKENNKKAVDISIEEYEKIASLEDKNYYSYKDFKFPINAPRRLALYKEFINRETKRKRKKEIIKILENEYHYYDIDLELFYLTSPKSIDKILNRYKKEVDKLVNDGVDINNCLFYRGYLRGVYRKFIFLFWRKKYVEALEVAKYYHFLTNYDVCKVNYIEEVILYTLGLYDKFEELASINKDNSLLYTLLSLYRNDNISEENKINAIAVRNYFCALRMVNNISYDNNFYYTRIDIDNLDNKKRGTVEEFFVSADILNMSNPEVYDYYFGGNFYKYRDEIDINNKLSSFASDVFFTIAFLILSINNVIVNKCLVNDVIDVLTGKEENLAKTRKTYELNLIKKIPTFGAYKKKGNLFIEIEAAIKNLIDLKLIENYNESYFDNKKSFIVKFNEIKENRPNVDAVNKNNIDALNSFTVDISIKNNSSNTEDESIGLLDDYLNGCLVIDDVITCALTDGGYLVAKEYFEVDPNIKRA